MRPLSKFYEIHPYNPSISLIDYLKIISDYLKTIISDHLFKILSMHFKTVKNLIKKLNKALFAITSSEQEKTFLFLTFFSPNLSLFPD